ncbi:hypothetical protein NX059_009070 [Plenodomus lindquistii]|nr:hypothetical protein NX059_009070 [Plenodomus lindquistii]
MAILEGVPGLEVCISGKHQNLREYQDRSTIASPNTAAHYIEAVSKAPFEVHACFTLPFSSNRAVEISISVDGKLLDELVIRPHELFKKKTHISAGPISDDHDDTASPELSKQLESVGTITVMFYFLKNVRLNRVSQSPRKTIKTFDALSEKDVKGASLSHQAILGKPKQVEQVEYLNAEHDDEGRPFATFLFYYRSLEALKDLHVVERTPDPIDLLDSDDGALAQMDREQLQAIVRRMREREEARQRTKRERSVSTVGGEGDAGVDEDPEFVETGSVDLRAKRRMVRGRAVPGVGCEIIVLD